LEGSVQRTGGKVRVNAQLIDARTDGHLWAQTYDRDIADVFAIQSEVAENIVAQLKANLPRTRKRRWTCGRHVTWKGTIKTRANTKRRELVSPNNTARAKLRSREIASSKQSDRFEPKSLSSPACRESWLINCLACR